MSTEEPLGISQDFVSKVQRILRGFEKIVQIYNEPLWERSYEYDDRRTYAYKLAESLEQFEEAIHFVTLAVSQRVQDAQFNKTHALFPLTDNPIGSRIYLAADNLIEYFVRRFFGDTHEIVSIPVFGVDPYYRTLMDSYVIKENNKEIPYIWVISYIPKIDLFRYRHWASLGHEIAHSRFYHKNITLFPFEDRGMEIFEKLRENIVNDLNLISGTTFGTYNINNSYRQFNEILCDLSSIVLLGPADLFTIATYYASPKLGAGAFDTHPPTNVRISYELRYLKSLRGQDSEFDKDLGAWEESWNLLNRNTDFTLVEKRYCEEYLKLMDIYFQRIVDFVKVYVIMRTGYFTPGTWTSICKMYDDAINGKSTIKEESTSVCRILNQGWGKRWVIFTKLFPAKEHSLEKFMAWHMKEQKLLWETVESLSGDVSA